MKEKVEKSKEMTKLAKELESRIKLQPLPLINIKKRKLSYDEFQDCLDIYENNQIYYKDNIVELKKLESWFSSIREPYPEGADEKILEEWRIREKNRISKGISDYCSDEVRHILENK